MKTLIALFFLTSISCFAGIIVIYPTNITARVGGPISGGCPSGYIGFANYAKTISNGWGWKPDTNSATVFTAVDTNSTTTKIQYVGKNGDIWCGESNVTISTHPPTSGFYRYTVFFTTNLPVSTNYPLVLTNSLP